MVKNISSWFDIDRLSDFNGFKNMCQEMEDIINVEHGTIVKGPQIIVTKSYCDTYAIRVYVIISYTPNTNNGYVKVNCSLTECRRNSKILTIESEHPVSLGIAGRRHEYIIAVWTETVSNEKPEAE